MVPQYMQGNVCYFFLNNVTKGTEGNVKIGLYIKRKGNVFVETRFPKHEYTMTYGSYGTQSTTY